MALAEARDLQRLSSIAAREAKVKQVTQELEEIKASQMRMEDTIYMLSIQNKQRQDDKELMLMLLPQIHKAINGKANNLTGLLQ